MNDLLNRLEDLMTVVSDDGALITDQLNAADELLMWCGPFITRAVVLRQLKSRFTLHAGCLADVGTGQCRCSDVAALLRLIKRGEVIWLDAMEPKGTDFDEVTPL